jgi:acyl-CoA reductase-like NAD-dependent aldehyde dehydrogenase
MVNFLERLYSDVENAVYKMALHGKVRKESKGYFIEPSIIDNPPENSRIVAEEPLVRLFL